MADGAQPRSAAPSNRAKSQHADLPTCGVIMPISGTASYTEEHWRHVQMLLHRAISAAGFTPRNVWENTATDRISERIIGNIFEVPLLVADISDLNPNVMLELGLRLASKKPTIVIANAGGEIPFDIRDFHATFYPPDMNMLGMEDFFRRLAKVLQEKYAAYKGEGYTPFLGNVIVDVASPETREVGLNELLLSRLEEISTRLGTVENAVKPPKNQPSQKPKRVFTGQIAVEIPDESVDTFKQIAGDMFEVDGIRLNTIQNGVANLTVHYSGVSEYRDFHTRISEMAQSVGGELDVPF